MCASWRKIINKEVKEQATEGSKDQPPSSPLLPDRTQHVRPHQPLQRRAQRRLPQRLHQVLLRQLHRRPFTRLLARLLRRLLRRLCLRLPSPTAQVPPNPCLCSAFQRRQLRVQVWVRGPPHPADTAWRAWGLGGSWGSDPRRHQSAVEAQGEAQRQQDLPLTTPMVPYWLVFSYFIIYQYNCNCFP